MMMQIPVNYVAVLVSGVIMMAIGYAWYGPLFGKQWMKLRGISKSDMKGAKSSEMVKSYGSMFISALVLSYVFAYIIAAFQINSILMAVTAAFWTWLGFVATTMSGEVIWAKRPIKLYVIEAGYYLVAMAVIGIVLALWR